MDNEETVKNFVFDDTIEIEKLIELLNSIFDKEESIFKETNELKTSIIELCGLSTEKLVAVYKHILKRETLINTYMLVNINFLISGYSTLDESIFDSDTLFVKDLERLLDIKLELSDDIQDFQTKLTYWYLACLKSMHKVEYTYLYTPQEIPTIYSRLLSSMNLLNMSQIVAKSDDISLKDIPTVLNAYPIISDMAVSSAISSELFQAFSI